MHRLLPAGRAPRHWSPQLRPRLVRWLRPLRKLIERRQEQIHAVEVAGREHLEAALATGSGVLITPNHYCYSDPFPLAHASDLVRRPFYYMAAWQALGHTSRAQRWVMRWHGCFSVDRDAADRTAFRQAADILAESSHPLVIFPEGEIYRVSDRLFPFREGCAAIALAAAKKGSRGVVALPCGLRYEYLQDVTPGLEEAVARLEQQLFLRPQPDRSLVERIVRIAEGALTLKELDYLSCTRGGAVAERVEHLGRAVLAEVAARHAATTNGAPLGDGVKALRQRMLAKREELPPSDPRQAEIARDLDEIFFVEQLACYPLPYLTESSASYRLAETLDKLEEDLLGLVIAPPRAPRRVRVTFDAPLPVDPARHDRAILTAELQSRVQAILDRTRPG